MENESQYSVLDRYLNAGSKAVREILPDALVTLHIETPNRQIYSMIMDAWEKGNVDYDVLGSSYYPFWWNTPDMLRDVQTLAKERGKLFAVMELHGLTVMKMVMVHQTLSVLIMDFISMKLVLRVR